MPVHEFLLLPDHDGDYSNWDQHSRNPIALTLHDDLILYFWDSLKWIPSINPSNPDEWGGHGLNYLGPTVINHIGGPKAAKIFDAWAQLLNESPAKLTLKGLYCWTEGDSVSEGEYESVIADRDQVVATLQQIAEFARQAATGEKFLLHNGI